MFLDNLSLDPWGYDDAQEIDELCGISPVVIMYIDRIAFYDILEKIEGLM